MDAGVDLPERLVIVPVSRLDARATRLLEYSRRIEACEHHALHVTKGSAEVWELGEAWMGRRPGLPLRTVDNDGGVATTVARVVELELAAGYDEVVVLIGRVGLRSRLHRCWRNRVADRIATAVSCIPGAVVAVMTDITL